MNEASISHNTTIMATNGIVIICVLLGCVRVSVCVEDIRCLTSNPYIMPHLHCSSQETIHVYRAFFGVAEAARSFNCGQPQYDSQDCMMHIDPTTEKLRNTCNSFQNCNPWISVPQDLVCGSSSSEEEDRTYLHVQYECVRGIDPNGQGIPLLMPLSDTNEAGTGMIIHLRSTNYPSAMQLFTSNSACLVHLQHPDAMLRVDILDLSYNNTGQFGESPYCLYMGRSGEVCAAVGRSYQVLDVEAEMDGWMWLWLWRNFQAPLYARFWIVLSVISRRGGGYGQSDWMTVYCADPDELIQDTPGYNHGVMFPPNTQQTTTPNNESIARESRTRESSMVIIIGGASAGGAVVIAIIVCLAVLCAKKRKRRKQENYDYICHTNIAIATKLGAHQRASNPNLSVIPSLDDAVYRYNDKIINEDEQGVYAELESQPVSPISPYATTTNRAPWENPASDPVYGNDDVICSNMESFQDQAVPRAYENQAQVHETNKGIPPPPPEEPRYTQKPLIPGAGRQRVGRKDKSSHTASTLTLQRKSQVMADLERLYAKPVKVKSDELDIVENDLYVG